MNAIHIRTEGMFCDACPPRIETEIERLPGVKAARAYRTMQLTSVLFDPSLVDPETIRERIETVGFDAHVLRAGLKH